MLAISLFTGFFAFAILCILELLFMESEQEPPRWLDYVDGPYTRKGYIANYITLKGRDW
jgi:hypothetical protein